MKDGIKRRIQERTQKALAQLEPEAVLESVTPLNPGVFLLERLRAVKRAKLKAAKRPPLKAQK